MAEKKTEDGVQFPAEAYLVVPDPEAPSTWKLRIWEDLDKKVTVRQLGRAAAALGPGFRGQRVQLTATQRQAAIRKLRGLYRQQDVDSADFPPVLQAAAHRVAQDRMRRNAKRIVEQFAADGTPEPLAGCAAEVREDLEILGEHYYSGFTATQDGALSFETVVAAAQTALDRFHRLLHADQASYAGGPSPSPSGPMYDCAGIRLVATFPEALVYEHYGNIFQVGYRLEGTTAILAEDPIEVTAEFLPVEAGEARQRAQVEAAADPARRVPRDILEARPAGKLREATLDREGRTIANTVLITAESVNGVAGKRKYSEQALRQIAEMADGLPAFANHVPKEQAFGPRDVKDLIGRHRHVRYEPERRRVVSDLHVLEHQADWVFALAEDLSDVVGNSLVSRGLVRMEGDTEIVEEIVAVRSGDLVSDPGATRGLFEHRSAWTGTQTGGERDMADKASLTLTEIRGHLAADPACAAALREELAGADLKAKDAALAAVTTERDEAKAALTEAKVQLDAHAAAKAARDKAERLAAVVAGSDLGTRFGKHAGAVTEQFRALLLETDEARWTALIADRVALIEASLKAAPGGPRSEFKPDGDGKVPEGAHARLYAALAR